MRWIAMSVMLSLVVLVRADSEPEPKPVAPPKADIRGKVEARMFFKGKAEQGTLRIVGTKEKDTQYDQAVVTVPSTAKIYTWKGGKKVDAKYDDIKKGDLVQVTFTGDIRESFPIQATASEVLILPAKK